MADIPTTMRQALSYSRPAEQPSKRTSGERSGVDRQADRVEIPVPDQKGAEEGGTKL